MPVAVVVPSTPLLLAGVSGGPVPEVLALRDACRAALSAWAPDVPVTVVGSHPDPAAPDADLGVADDHAFHGAAAHAPALGQGPSWWPSDLTGTVAGLGAPTPPGDGSEVPLALTVGRWLLTDAGHRGPVDQVTVPADAPTDRCVAWGRAWADRHLLVVGDGTFCRGPKPPGGPDPRAEDVDDTVARALADGDRDALLRLPPSLAAELGVTGRAPWQVLAGWAGDRPVTPGPVRHEAPFGVAYLVATWDVPAAG